MKLQRIEYPNRDALLRALDVYLHAMPVFIRERLVDKAPISDALEVIDIARILRDYQNAFEGYFKTTEDQHHVRNAARFIVEGRNRVAHTTTKDLDSEFTRTQLFLIADVLKKINMLDAQRKVEEIRDALFPQDSPEHLAQVKRDLTSAKVENSRLSKALEVAKKNLEDMNAGTSSSEKRLVTEAKLRKDAEREKRALAKRCKELESAGQSLKTKLKDTQNQLSEVQAALAAAEAENEALEKRLEIEPVETETVVSTPSKSTKKGSSSKRAPRSPMTALAQEMGVPQGDVKRALRAQYRKDSAKDIERITGLKVSELKKAEAYAAAWKSYKAKRDAEKK